MYVRGPAKSFAPVIALLALAAGCAVVIEDPLEEGGAGGGIAGGNATGGQTNSAGGEANGAGGEGGQGGSEPVPRKIEVEFAIDPAFLDGAFIVVSAVDGAFKSYVPAADSPTFVEVVDGDLVSFFDGDNGSSPLIESYRVTPEVDRISNAAEGLGFFPGCEPIEPMQLTVSVPSVPGATSYRVYLEPGSSKQSSEPFEASFEVTCASGPLNVFATALFGSEIVAYEMVEDVPLQPGGSAHVELELSETARTTMTINVGDVDGADEVAASAHWNGLYFGTVMQSLEGQSFAPPEGPFTFAPAIISPPGGYPVVMASGTYPKVNGACRTSGFSHLGFTDETLTFDVGALAEPRPTDRHSWSFVDDGEIGDSLWQSWTFDFDVRWLVHEDPARPPLPSVFPQLPDDLPPELVRPQGTQELYSVGHEAWDRYEGFADSTHGDKSIFEGSNRFRNFVPCE
ncbi:MAG: hypothetical protein HOW73_28110 [Polyangiaceae bacterium]|nr:hypothetical protein [Polyangiaceae bacterium]